MKFLLFLTLNVHKNSSMKSIKTKIFDELKEGKVISPNHPEINQLRASSYKTISLIQKLNFSSDPEEHLMLLREITGKYIDRSVAIFPPIYINNGTNLEIGKNVFINFDCTFLALGGIVIEDDVLIGPKVSILSEGHPLNPEQRHSLIPQKIIIKRNVWIGANSTLLSGITIGENAVIAAGSVVTKDVPANTLVAGIPAKRIKSIEDEI